MVWGHLFEPTFELFLYFRIDKCFCSTDTQSCNISYGYAPFAEESQREQYQLKVGNVSYTKLSPPIHTVGDHAFLCREPGDENVLVCERWNLDISVCLEHFRLCPHRWEFSSCSGTSTQQMDHLSSKTNHSIKLCRLKSTKNSLMNQSVIEKCQYGFTPSVLPSKSSPSLTTEPLTTSEESSTTQTENSGWEWLNFDNIPLAVWVLLCCNLLFTVANFLTLVVCRKQKVRGQSKDVSANAPNESVVIDNVVSDPCAKNPPSTSGADLRISETGNEGKLAQVQNEKVYFTIEDAGDDPQGLNLQACHDGTVPVEDRGKDHEEKISTN